MNFKFTTNKLHFLKEGASVPKKSKKPVTGILHRADDWRLLVDLDPPLVVPPFLAVTAQAPDILLISHSSRSAVIIELTVPCEENF